MKRYGGMLGLLWGWLSAAGAQPQGSSLFISPGSTSGEFQITFASPEPSGYAVNDIVWARYFVPRGTGPFPAVLVLHSLGTSKAEREQEFCRKLRRQGLASLLLWLPFHGPRAPEGCSGGQWMISPDLERTTRALHQAIADARAGMDWLAARPEIDASRLGILGLSLGAVLAVPVMGQEPRLQAGVLLLGGGDLVKLFRKSLLLGGLRLAWQKEGLTAADLRARWKDLEPLNFAAAVRGRALLMVNGYYDSIIPTDCSKALWKALGRPPQIRINAGHYGGIFYSALLLDQSVRFFADFFHGLPIDLSALRRATEFPALKLCWLHLQGKNIRPGVALEMLWLDPQKNFSVDVGWVPGRFFAGLALDTISVGNSPLLDVGFGYAVSIHGQEDPYVAVSFHF